MKNLRWNFKTGISSLLIFAGLVIASNASALPAFARKNNMQCSSCHAAYPTLTAFGRQFKEDGYRITGSTQGSTAVSKNLQLDKTFPLSLALISRPYVDSKSGVKENRAIHEAELYAGGEIYKNISGYLELESEGEDGFGVVLGQASVTYNQSKVLNAQVGFGPTLMADPYDTYADMRRLTATHYSMFNLANNADNNDKLRHSRQQVAVYGRANNLFYYGGVGGLTGDNTGSDSSIYFARVAYDFTPGMMVGAMALNGECKISETNCAVNRNFNRFSLDGQFDIGDVRLTSVFMQAKDDNTSGVEESNNSYYVQAFYIMKSNGRPTFVPLLRLDNYQENNGTNKYALATIGLSYYFEENVKGFIEYQDIYDTPTGVAKDHNVTLQFEVVF